MLSVRLPGGLFVLAARALLAGPFVMLLFFVGGCPVTGVAVQVINAPLVACLRDGDGVDGSRRWGVVDTFRT